MKMALKKSHKLPIWMIIMIIMITVGCNLPGPFQNSSPNAETLPENPTQETKVQLEIPTLEATSPEILPTQSSPSDINNRADCLAGIIPGKTNRDEVIALFSPIKEAWAAIPEQAKQEAYSMSQSSSL